MRVADVILKFLADKGVDTIFMITGGQAMFLNDAVYQNKKIKPIFTHHEQAAGMAAEAYGRITGNMGVAMVTAGPGAVNVLNGVVGGYTDSGPMMIISGQAALSAVQYQEKTGIRQFGVQGINIRPLAQPVTKYFITVDDPNKILYYVQKAYHIATTGRTGPVWLDVPLDIQGKQVTYEKLLGYTPPKEKVNRKVLKKQVKETITLLQKAKRPILLVGQGVRMAHAIQSFREVLEKVQMPVLTARLGIDLIETDNKLYVGRPGTYGERSANFATQNADVILSVGCRLGTSLIGHNAKDFGRNAKIIVVDIDKKELEKPGPTLTLKINTDARIFFNEMLMQLTGARLPKYTSWIKQCNVWKQKYPVVLPSYKKEKPVNSYYFIDKLSKIAKSSDLTLVDTGGCFHVAAQTWKVKKGQRFLTTGGISSMGYWVAGIGACLANKSKRTIVITGDGSLQMNIQEFATIKRNNLPIKVFILNNNGYSLIRLTQKNFMDGRLLGVSPDTGLFLPDSLKIAKAYGIKGVRIKNITNIDRKIKQVLDYPGPVICDVLTPEWQLLIPRTASDKKPDGTLVAKPYEDMFPFLPPEELAKNMIGEIKKEEPRQKTTFVSGE